MKLTYELSLRSPKTGKPLKRKKKIEAGSEQEARAIAEDQGLIVIGVEAIDSWCELVEVAGVSFKNPDNTSRYKVIRACRVGDDVTLEHESGNRHDAHAIRVLDGRGRQMGFLERHVAARVMNWYEAGRSPHYSAVIEEIETWDGGGRPFLRVVLAAPSADEQKIVERIQAAGIRNPSQYMPRTLLESKPRATMKRGAATKGGGGCAVLVATMAAACTVIALSIF